MTYHFVYRTSCPSTEQFYIGVHSTDDLDDGYVGSGLWPTRYIRKHGRGVLLREIIDFFPTRQQAENRERSIVSLVMGEELCMNLAPGGCGHSPESARAWRMARRERLGGCSKEIDPAIAQMADALRGRTKETHPYIRLAAQKSGNKTRGRTKETHAGVAKMAAALTGRTKGTHLGPRACAEKKRGQTKETHPGRKAQAEKMTGRTKETHPGIAMASVKKTKIKDPVVIQQMLDLRADGAIFRYIRDALGLPVTCDTVANTIRRAMAERNETKELK